MAGHAEMHVCYVMPSTTGCNPIEALLGNARFVETGDQCFADRGSDCFGGL